MQAKRPQHRTSAKFSAHHHPNPATATATSTPTSNLHAVEGLVRASREAAEARAAHERVVNERLARQRLEMLGRLSGGVAHDFNNILTVIVSGLDSLRRLTDDAQRAEVLDDLDAAAASARATTRQLLSLSRQGHAPGGTTDPTAALPLLAKMLQRVFPETFRIEAKTALVPHVALSAGALEQALLALCLDARDAMPGGGVLRLRAERDGAFVRIDVEAENACGTPNPSTPKPHGVGAALGLPVVRDVAASCGGRLEVPTDPTKASSAALFVPVAASASEARVTTEPAARGAKILLLEDDPAVQRAFALVLRATGHAVTTASTVREAEAAVAAHAPFDLFLSDAVLPDGNPGALIRSFKTRYPRTPVLVCSGHLLDDVMVDGVERSQFHFLQKPVLPSELRRVVAELLRQAVDR